MLADQIKAETYKLALCNHRNQFDMDIQKKPLLLQMQHVQDAQAFAITLEPRGGSALPTMTSMYVMGSL